MGKGLIDLLLDSIFDANWVGHHGEKLTERELKLVKLFGRDGKILRNVYVPKDNGETSEIDVIFITQKGIFVIESKNYSGWIFGDEKSAYWTAMLENRQKNRFYNPIKQNRTHIKWLGHYLENKVPLYSIVVFSERCELKKVTVDSPDIRVIKRDYLYAVVRDIWNKTEDQCSREEVNEIYKKLEVLTHVDKAQKEAHIENINAKYKRTEKREKPVKPEKAEDPKETEKLENAEYSETSALTEKKASSETEKVVQKEIEAAQDEKMTASESAKVMDAVREQDGQPSEKDSDEKTEASLICPRCGGSLVLRVAKKGANAGNSFYGCSNYPKCRYVKNIDPQQN